MADGIVPTRWIRAGGPSQISFVLRLSVRGTRKSAAAGADPLERCGEKRRDSPHFSGKNSGVCAFVKIAGGAKLVTLADARAFILKRAKRQHRTQWDGAIRCLLQAAETGSAADIKQATSQIELCVLLSRKAVDAYGHLEGLHVKSAFQQGQCRLERGRPIRRARQVSFLESE
jgi:hypothetical protein